MISKNSIGKKFNRLLVLEESYKNNRKYLRCRCDCGVEKTINASHVRSSHTKSCGCLAYEISKTKNVTHGATKSYKATSEYRAWRNLLTRCNAKKGRYFEDYVMRGITVYDLWKKDFQAFISFIGLKPAPEYTLERIDNDKGYFPGNVKWALRGDQSSNRRPYGKTGTRGVYKHGDKFRAVLHVPDTGNVHLGGFDTLEQADAAYRKARAEIRNN